MQEPQDQGLLFLPATRAKGEFPFVAVARTAADVDALCASPPEELQWIQIHGLLEDSGVWQRLAQNADEVPLDVVVPAESFSDLYRLVDVRNARDVRVTIPAEPGFMKAVRLAASLGLHIRVLPGQPSEACLKELQEAASFYLHDPMVEAPIEFFQSALAFCRGPVSDSLWFALEEDPAVYRIALDGTRLGVPRSSDSLPDTEAAEHFVEKWITGLVAEEAECATCPWQKFCGGYFKWPDRTYDCAGVKKIFGMIDEAAEAMGHQLEELKE